MALMFFTLIICITGLVKIEGVEHKEPDYGPVAYEFHYAVHDEHTGDIKSQKETRKDDKVEGSYELIDSDGHHRIVHYKADDHNGFEAIVERKPTDLKIPFPAPYDHKKVAKIQAPAALVHYANHAHENTQYVNHVSFSAPNSNYKY